MVAELSHLNSSCCRCAAPDCLAIQEYTSRFDSTYLRAIARASSSVMQLEAPVAIWPDAFGIVWSTDRREQQNRSNFRCFIAHPPAPTARPFSLVIPQMLPSQTPDCAAARSAAISAGRAAHKAKHICACGLTHQSASLLVSRRHELHRKLQTIQKVRHEWLTVSILILSNCL